MPKDKKTKTRKSKHRPTNVNKNINIIKISGETVKRRRKTTTRRSPQPQPQPQQPQFIPQYIHQHSGADLATITSLIERKFAQQREPIKATREEISSLSPIIIPNPPKVEPEVINLTTPHKEPQKPTRADLKVEIKQEPNSEYPTSFSPDVNDIIKRDLVNRQILNKAKYKADKERRATREELREQNIQAQIDLGQLFPSSDERSETEFARIQSDVDDIPTAPSNIPPPKKIKKPKVSNLLPSGNIASSNITVRNKNK